MCSSRVFNAHPEGMLDRDQRTTMTVEWRPVQCDCADEQFDNMQFFHASTGCDASLQHSSLACRCRVRRESTFMAEPRCLNCGGCSARKQMENRDKCSSRSYKIRNYNKSKFSDFLLVGFCIWTLSLQISSAKPFSMEQSRTILMNILSNPCNTHNDEREQHVNLLRSHFEPIAFQSNVSLDKGDALVNDYFITSGMMQHFASVAKMNEELGHEKQIWLYSNGPGIPKKYKEKMPNHILDVDSAENSWPDFLINSDIGLQRLIIGFHRSATAEMSLDMSTLFETARDHAQAILCEIRSTMNRANIPSVLQISEQLSDTDANDTWFNWVMLREYINQLEYISEMSQHIVNSVPA